MAVRKRRWTNDKGEHREAWVVDYSVNGKRHTKTFERKRDADRYHAGVTVDVGKGVHTPESRSLTVAQAAEQWLAYVELEGLERSTIDHYRTHVNRHIKPRIGATKLATLTTPTVNGFRDELLADLSRAMARKVLVSFRSIIKDARRRGTIAHNVTEGVTIKNDRRADRKLEAGRDIPNSRRGASHPGGRTARLARLPGRGGLHRPACLRAARFALEGYRLVRRRCACAPAR